ncbi:MAG: hypothetical protein WC694_02830 [Candidatus Paceibacterota bacterium]|jgi:hypothetical protein
MNKNQKVAIIILIVIFLGLFIFYFIFRSKSPPPPLTEAEVRQALIDSTTAPITSIPMNPKEIKQLIDSTTAPTQKQTPALKTKQPLTANKYKYNEN